MHGKTFSIIVPSWNHPKFPIKIQLPTSASGTIADNAPHYSLEKVLDFYRERASGARTISSKANS